MSRQAWKDAAEAIGFLAIVASLIFVGIETRNSTHQAELNTRALEIAAYAELQSNIEAFNALGIESAESAVACDVADDEWIQPRECLQATIQQHNNPSDALGVQTAIGLVSGRIAKVRGGVDRRVRPVDSERTSTSCGR